MEWFRSSRFYHPEITLMNLLTILAGCKVSLQQLHRSKENTKYGLTIRTLSTTQLDPLGPGKPLELGIARKVGKAWHWPGRASVARGTMQSERTKGEKEEAAARGDEGSV